MIAMQMAMLGAFGLDYLGLEIPILRQVVGFIYLTFLPGFILLRLLRVHRLGVAVTVLLSAGLSISFLMFSGFFINLILPLLNIGSPLSSLHVIISITILLNVLLIISYKTDKFYQYELPPLGISASSVYLMLLPVLSILGTYLVNFHNNNIVLLILIALIALIPVLVAFNKIAPELYPLALIVVALSLLFHRSLISMYLTGSDIHIEYYFHRLVVDNAYWNLDIPNNVNAMLSIVILPAVYSYFLNLDGAWIFKIVYSIIFSLVPLGLFCVYQHQIKSDKIAFFSVFFFMSFRTFFAEMFSLSRQEIAEFFLVLILFLMVQETINKNIRNTLLLIFGASLITSHYGLSYIYVILLIITFLFSLDIIRTSRIKLLNLSQFSLKKSTLNYFLAFYIIFILLWYINVSGSSAFNAIVGIGDHIYGNLFNEYFTPKNTDRNVLMAVGIVDPVISSAGREVFRVLQFISQFFIIIGFFKIIIYRENSRLKAEYFYLIVASFAILLLSLLPYTASTLNMTRIYHIALLAISPLFIVGGIFVIENLLKTIDFKNRLKQDHFILILVLGVLIPYYMFNTGFVFEMTKDSPTSMPLGMERMKNDNKTKSDFYADFIPEYDIYSARWYHENSNGKVYGDRDSARVLRSYGMTAQRIENPFRRVKPIEYNVYFRKLNICDNIVLYNKQKLNLSQVSPLTNRLSKVYSNDCGEIYKQ
jgi:uncharacterized membrane protein